MGVMKKYEFSIEYKILIPLFLIFFTSISLPPYDDFEEVAAIFFSIFIWYHIIYMPYSICLSDSGYMIFKTIWKTIVLPPTDVIKIEDSIFSYKVSHTKGHLYISTLMKEPYGLKNFIENTDPSVEITDINLQAIEQEEKQSLLVRFAIILGVSIFSIFIKYLLYSSKYQAGL